jgi:hypothetical protein
MNDPILIRERFIPFLKKSAGCIRTGMGRMRKVPDSERRKKLLRMEYLPDLPNRSLEIHTRGNIIGLISWE